MKMAENTFFGEIHKELDAKMSPFGKWNMPLFYPGGSVAEHRHTRAEASVFDMSGARIFQLTGQNAAEVLDEILLYDASDIAVGNCMKNILLHDNGTFAAMFTLCRMQENDFMRGKSAYKLIQYLGAGLPCIASPVGENKVLLSHGGTGFAATTADEWLNALQQLKNNENMRLEMGRNAFALAKEYSIQKYAPVMADFIKDCFKAS